jgi:starch phosphorylase
MVDHYLGAYYDSLKISQQELHALGGVNREQTKGKFNMAIFAINMSSHYNGVSALHGQVARSMWQYLWPEAPESEVPIGHVTNGVHIRTWISDDVRLYSICIWVRAGPATQAIKVYGKNQQHPGRRTVEST